MKYLVIAEKPSLGRDIASALQGSQKKNDGYIEVGNDWIVSWVFGHIFKSYEPHQYDKIYEKWDMKTLPILVNDWKVYPDIKAKKQFDILKKLMSQVDVIVHAGDADREGQLIVDEILEYVNNKKPVKRLLLTAMDKKSIQKSLNSMGDNQQYYPLYQSGICRGYADWHMGMNATRAYSLNAQQNGYKGVLSIGRVQTPTINIVVERDNIIDNFVPHDYFLVHGFFSENQNYQPIFKAQYVNPDNLKEDYLDEDGRLINKSWAEKIIVDIQGKDAKVISAEEKPGKQYAPLPFSLSKLQIYAGNKWGMGAKEVLDICQSLYEVHKIQSYPRTEIQYVPESYYDDAKTIINNISNASTELSNACQGVNYSIKSAAFNDKNVKEHFGLVPTIKQADLSLLNDKEKKIYLAVCERFIAQFYPPCEYLSTVIKIHCNGHDFKSTGKVITSLGWKGIFSNTSEEDDDDEENQKLPKLANGQDIYSKEGKLLEKKTTPPPRFSEATLIEAMANVHLLVKDPVQKQKLKDKKGLGQAATRPQIIETLYKRNFLIKKGKKIESTPTAKEFCALLPKKIKDPILTAIWEDGLDKVAAGTLSMKDFQEKQKQWVTQIVSESKLLKIVVPSSGKGDSKSGNSTSKNGSSSSKPTNNSIPAGAKKCPKCNVGFMKERVAKTSGKKFLGCSNWPNCNHVEWPK